MKLLLIGHEDRYAVEQLQLALFPLEPMEPMTEPFEGDGAVSRLIREQSSLIARTTICLNGITRTAVIQTPASSSPKSAGERGCSAAETDALSSMAQSAPVSHLRLCNIKLPPNIRFRR